MSATPRARFRGRTVLVTGASRGLGRAIAEAFAVEGAFVGLGFRARSDEADAALAGLRATGGDGVTLRFDLRDGAAVEGAVRAFVAGRGGIDVLVNCAGVSPDEPTLLATDEAWSDALAVNLTGPFRLCRAVARAMVAARRGAIVNVGSVSSQRPLPAQAAYAASKGGLLALTRALAVELGPRDVRVNAVVAGPAATGMAARLDHRLAERLRAAIPLGRFARPGEIAAATLFLASDDARYVTGQALAVDGGLGA